ncbi:MHFG family PEP-CTERM protein [Scleromatobacter humisilvae]|uniref:MHFG family PEP-CTERM protein n=1 Tax=Scleromatobacter humisilvae TaxID=2897159 RepID=A0A9X1YKB6_9BURK|nr:MHFG family PEP-CTERM protein [Scleromatobacter humisilvae]MCK9686428.1 MHFG family PEP-CTERM protein [Scleromatobacter humisilvae]
MSIGLQLILSTSLVVAQPGCSWAHPGANPYRGDPARAVADFDLSEPTRRQLRALMAAHRYTDVATITRDDIVGAHAYTGLREMHSGHGQVCRGEVDRSAWSATHRERGLVYCVAEACVIVPTVCNNVSLVSRRPDRVAALDDGPIDIEPAAGPPASTPADTPSDLVSPLDFLPPPDIVGAPPGAPEPPAGGAPIGAGAGAGGGGGGGAGGGDGCCDIGPIGPGGPGGGGGGLPVNPPPAVPEAPTWLLLLAGVGAILARLRARGDAQARSRSGCACAGHGDAKYAATIAASTSATFAGFQRGA